LERTDPKKISWIRFALMMKWVAAVLGLLLRSSRGEDLLFLRPDSELRDQVLLDGASKGFKVETPLPADAAFEVRVSYLSTTPGRFSFQVVDGFQQENQHLDPDEDLRRRRRRRLNTERFRIYSDAHGLVRNGFGKSLREPILIVSAVWTGVRPSKTGSAEISEKIPFNIALDRLYGFDSLPRSSLWMIAWGLLSVLLGVKVLQPALKALM